MSEKLDDCINVLFGYIVSSKVITDRDTCISYLRSTCQKHLFAEKRLQHLIREIKNYKRKYKKHQDLDRFNIEIEFDHCILSLRSCLDHLAQLINHITEIGLSPRSTKGKSPVTIQNVTSIINKDTRLNNNQHLLDLATLLSEIVKTNWYIVLHDLRIEFYHVSSDGLYRNILLSLKNNRLRELKFHFHTPVSTNLLKSDEREIIAFCNKVIDEVEHILKTCFELLSDYLS